MTTKELAFEQAEKIRLQIAPNSKLVLDHFESFPRYWKFCFEVQIDGDVRARFTIRQEEVGS